jgi:tetratricopeptide (TPR) repeat protein
LSLGKKDKAMESLVNAAKKNPNYITPFVELGLLLEGEESLGYLMEAVQMNPFDPRIHQKLLEIYRSQNRSAEAEREVEVLQLLLKR